MSPYPRVAGVVSQQGTDISSLCNSYGDAEQMPPQTLVACGITESNLDERAERYGEWPDVSFGMWQQTVLYAPIGDQSQSAANIAYVRGALWNVSYAASVAAPQLGQFWREYGAALPSLEAGLCETLGRYNWPTVGYVGNPNAANIARGVAASAAYVQEDAVQAPSQPRIYDAFCSPERQQGEWTCSARTTTWMLRSIGVATSIELVLPAMLQAGLITEVDGLLDGSGTDLADWISDTYQIECRAMGVMDWATLNAQIAGYGPVGIGAGLPLYHWLAVRYIDGPYARLMNPAPGYQDVWEDFTEGGYNQWAPWYGIWIPVEPAGPPAPEEGTLSQQQLDRLVYLENWHGLVVGDYMDKLQTENAKLLGAADLAEVRTIAEHGIQPVINTIRAG